VERSVCHSGRTASPPVPIADALAHESAHSATNAIVSYAKVDAGTAKVSGVAFLDRSTPRAYELRKHVVVLCAPSIESARLLLASAPRDQLDGLATSSGAVGRYLMDLTKLGIDAEMPLEDARA
jgi:choline dehydrogenase-like flavoprotein